MSKATFGTDNSSSTALGTLNRPQRRPYRSQYVGRQNRHRETEQRCSGITQRLHLTAQRRRQLSKRNLDGPPRQVEFGHGSSARHLDGQVGQHRHFPVPVARRLIQFHHHPPHLDAQTALFVAHPGFLFVKPARGAAPHLTQLAHVADIQLGMLADGEERLCAERCR